MSRFGSKGKITISEVRMSLIFLNAAWFSGSACHVVLFFKRGCIALVICARSGLNDPSWLASPRNTLTYSMHEGVGNRLIAANFFSSGLIPVSDIMSPANAISFPISFFFREMVILFSLHCSSTVLERMTRSSSLSALIMVLSTNFLFNDEHKTGVSAVLYI